MNALDRKRCLSASDWGEPAERKRVRPALRESYEDLFHQSGLPRFWINLRPSPSKASVPDKDSSPGKVDKSAKGAGRKITTPRKAGGS